MKLVQTIVLLFISTQFASAQKTTFNISVEGNSIIKEVELSCFDLKYCYQHNAKDGYWETDIPIKKGSGQWSEVLTEPVFMNVSIKGMPDREIFLTPGDSLHLSIKKSILGQEVFVTGTGSNNNQSSSLKGGLNYEKYKSDTLPDRFLRDMQQAKERDSAALETYIKNYQPTDNYITARRMTLRYQVLDDFYSYYGNHKFDLDRLPRHEQLDISWQRALDSLMNNAPLNNESALQAPDFGGLISTFLLRKKEDLWEAASEKRGAFYQEWYGDSTRGAAIFNSDMQNLLTESIINKYLSGKVAALAYANLLHESLGEKEDNLPAIYDRLALQYPDNPYLSFLTADINSIREKNRRTLNDKMIFVNGGDSMHHFSELQQLLKGKTVLVDMWGTWCEPCRAEINTNAQALKAHFKGKEVTFLYIANYDLTKDSLWRKLIAYYALEGMHILAQQDFTNDIMKKTGANGFPSYILFKKDGSYELSKAGYPMNRKKLIKQIEAAL